MRKSWRDRSSSASPVSAASRCRAATCLPNIRCRPRVRRRRRPRRKPSRQSRRLRSSVHRVSSRPSSQPHRHPPSRLGHLSHHRLLHPNPKSSSHRRLPRSCIRRRLSPSPFNRLSRFRKLSSKSRLRLRLLKKKTRRLRSPLLPKPLQSPHKRRRPRRLLAASCRQRFDCASKSPAGPRNRRVHSRPRSVRRSRSRRSFSHPQRRRPARRSRRSQRSLVVAALGRARPVRCGSLTRRRVRRRPACLAVLVHSPRSRYARSSHNKRARACRLHRVSARRSVSSNGRLSDSSGRPWGRRDRSRPSASVLRRRACRQRLRHHRRLPARLRSPKA